MSSEQLAKIEEMQSAIEQLEYKVAFQEDSIEQLNSIIIKQQNLVDRHDELIQALMEKLKTMQSGSSQINQEHELPPHY
ncbi:SlyX family protein [Glaciecola sp. MH2013]|uniref:SlyX family protein n=1 Tax=Glaciecola sp. MH2013 TaxID=2785524 RepID=UPI001E626A16|nr:SlyX family protein [Glaciecola sp. MH2013]